MIVMLLKKKYLKLKKNILKTEQFNLYHDFYLQRSARGQLVILKYYYKHTALV